MKNGNEVLINNNLVSEIYGTPVEVDLSQAPVERMACFLKTIERPDIIIGDDYQIELAWSDSAHTIQNCIQELLTLTQ